MSHCGGDTDTFDADDAKFWWNISRDPKNEFETFYPKGCQILSRDYQNIIL